MILLIIFVCDATFVFLWALGLKSSPSILRLIAKSVLKNFEHEVFSASFIQPEGELQCSLAKEEFIEQETTFHMGVL